MFLMVTAGREIIKWCNTIKAGINIVLSFHLICFRGWRLSSHVFSRKHHLHWQRQENSFFFKQRRFTLRVFTSSACIYPCKTSSGFSSTRSFAWCVWSNIRLLPLLDRASQGDGLPGWIALDGSLIIWPPVRRRLGQKATTAQTDGPSKDPPHLHSYRKMKRRMKGRAAVKETGTNSSHLLISRKWVQGMCITSWHPALAR